VGDESVQDLIRLTKTEEGVKREDLGGCRFVKLIGKHGWSENKTKAGVFLGLLLISGVLFLASCAPQRVPFRQPPRQKGVYHVVERHQTLYRICKTYGVDINRVASLNRIPDHGKIDVGQRISYPGATKVLKVRSTSTMLFRSRKEKKRFCISRRISPGRCRDAHREV